MAALKKELRIMRTPEDASKLSQQVFWNKKIQGDARSQRHRWSGYKEHGNRLHEIAAHLAAHYATVSRHLKRTEEQSGKCMIARHDPQGLDRSPTRIVDAFLHAQVEN